MSILYYFIDEETRKLRPEAAHKVVAQKDHNADVIRVGIPEAMDSVDLETSAVRCMYQRPKETEVRSKTAAYYDTSGGYLWYDWTLQEGDTSKAGKINFSVCLQHIEGGLLTVDWNTTIGEIHVKTSYHSDDSEEGDESITPTVSQRVAILESVVQRIAGGAPVVVGSVSEMVDEGQIYVLSTDGYWYYHNGTTWTQGGGYGAVSTDTTLTQSGIPADANAVGAAIDAVEALVDNAIEAVGDSISETETAMDALERRVDGVTTYGYEEMFDGVFANYARDVSTGKIYESELMRSTNFISAENGATYKISVSGSFNRLSIYGCYGNAVGANADTVHFEEGAFTEKEYTFVNSNNYPYFIVLLAYSYPSFSASLSIIRSFGDNTNGFSVNGVRVYSADETDTLIGGISASIANIEDSVDEKVLNVTGGDFYIPVTESYLTGKGIRNNVIIETTDQYIAYFENIAGTKVDISISGGYNRFAVYYGDSLDINTELTRLIWNEYGTGTTQRENSYTIDSSDDRRYILVFYSYSAVGNVEFDISIQNHNGNFSVNGVRVYTAEETDVLVDGVSDGIDEKIINITDLNYRTTVEESYLTGKGIQNNIIRTASGYYIAYFENIAGAKVDITVSGVYNRFGVYYGDSLDVNTELTRLTLTTYSTNTQRVDNYTINSSENKRYILIFYSYNTVGDVEFNISVQYNHSDFSVNGVRVYTADETDTLVDGVSNGIDTRVLGITTYGYEEMFDGVFANYGKKTSTGKIISSPESFRSTDFISAVNGATYKITVSGTFNRIAVYGCDGNAVGANADTVHFEEGAFTEKEYTFVNSNNYPYFIVLLAYSYPSFSVSLSIARSFGDTTNDFAVNGVRVYTAEEIGSLQRYNGYISGKKVQTVNTVAELYALYDALVASYPYAISKTLLGQGTGNLDMVEYAVTLGNYNTYTTNRRNEDSAIIKPVILILTGCHGYERSSIMGVYQFVKDMLDGNVIASEVLAKFTFKIIPCGCPYSFDNNQRINANNVNIERNFDTAIWTYQGEGTFDYGGATAADQPETVIIQDWIDANTNAALLIDFHNSGYLDEVSFLYGDNSYAGVASLKELYLKAIHERIPYFIHEEGYANTLLYAYTGSGFGDISTAYRYAIENNILAVCLECSYNINSTGLNSAQTNKTNAEVLGTILTHYANE